MSGAPAGPAPGLSYTAVPWATSSVSRLTGGRTGAAGGFGCGVEAGCGTLGAVRALPPRSEVQTAARAMGQHLDEGELRDAFRLAGEFGLLGAHLPAASGGGGLEGDALAETWEGAGEGCEDAGRLFAMAAHALAVVAPLAHHGEAGARYLPGLIEGSLIGAHAASEAEAGSDVMSMKTRAEPDGGGFRISGEKLWVSNGAEADVFIVFARVGDEPTGFVLERGSPGLEVGAPMDKMGLAGASLTTLYLDAAPVARAQIVGPAGAVFDTAMRYERALILAPQVGAMRRQLERAAKHARGRRQFGRPIGKNQLVAARVVDMYERYALARLLLRDSARALVAGTLSAPAACLTKLRLGEWALEQHLDAVRVHGGTGYVRETGLPASVADGVGGVLYSGTSDMMRVIIAAHLGL